MTSFPFIKNSDVLFYTHNTKTSYSTKITLPTLTRRQNHSCITYKTEPFSQCMGEKKYSYLVWDTWPFVP